MSIFMQIGIGLVPSIIVILLLCIKRKVFSPKIFLLMLSLTLICIGMFFTSTKRFDFANMTNGSKNNVIKNKTENSISSYPSKEQMLAITNKLFVNEEYNLVNDLIDDYSNIYDYDNECRLLNARMSLAKTDYSAANALYQNLKNHNKLNNKNSDELEFTTKLSGGNLKDSQVINYLVNTGSDLSEYGYKDSDYREIVQNSVYDNEEIISSIKIKIEKDYRDDTDNTISTIADIFARVSNSDGKYANLKNDIEKLNEIIKDNSSLLNISVADKINVKANFLNENYEEIVSNLSDDSSYHSLVVAADLIIGKVIGGNTSNNINDRIDDETVILINKKLEDIKNKNIDSLNNQQKNALDDRISSLNNQLEDSTLYSIKNKLVECDYDENDESKINFALAKINSYFGNDILSNDYLNNAINTAYKSDDKSYKDAMNNLGLIINNDNKHYNISNITNYINNANVNSLTVGNNIELPVQVENVDKLNFEKNVTNNVIKAKNYISIGEIDASNFKTVSANVIMTNEQLKSVDELKNIVEVRDCGSIVDARFEKIDYDSINIMLACDVSGSMADNIDSLKNSINKFIDDQNDNEKLSIISFDSNILGEKPFDSSKESLYKFVDGFKANGGTNIYGTVKNCINRFPYYSNSKNILIVMTDGQDGTSHKVNEINAEIGQLAKDNMVTIYTMGLGSDVDESYLNYIASAGGGNYIPVQDGSSLSTFYDMLHMQANNLYRITYGAVNESEKYDRTLEVAFPDTMYKDIETYSLINSNEAQGSFEFKGGQVINGLYPQSIYKSDYETNVVLKGQSFNKDDDISISFSGPVEYSIDTYFKDNENYHLAIPKNISVGNYDVVVTINDTKKVLYNAFRVNEVGERKWLKFGAYNFTYESNDFIDRNGGILSGNVQMNGWLNFKGKLVFSGNFEEDYKLEFTDSSGSYIEFDKNNATGRAKEYAEKNLVMDLPAFNKFKLYNDEYNRYDYDEYQVDGIKVSRLEFPDFLALDEKTLNNLYLYPDKIAFSINGTLKLLPFDKTIRKITSGSFPVEFGINLEEAVISNTLIGMKISTDFSMSDVMSSLIPIYIFNQKIITSPSAKLTLDTIKDEFEVELACELGFMGKTNDSGELDSPGVGLGFGFKENVFEKLKINAISPKPVIIVPEPPIEMNNFTFETSNISDAIKSGNWAKIKLTGQVDFSSCKASEYLPFLKKIKLPVLGQALREAALISMPETTLSLTISPFGIEGSAKVMLLGLIEGASYEMKIGNYNYTSSLLNIRDEDLFGFLGSKKSGLTMNGICGYFEDNFILDVSGEITGMANQRFIGFTNLGTTKIKLSFWAFDPQFSSYSESAIGFYTTHNGKQMLVLAIKDQNIGGKNKSSFYYLDENWSVGQKNGRLT